MEHNSTFDARASAQTSAQSWRMAPTCRPCGRAPAADFRFTQVSGKVIRSSRLTVDGRLCRDCARELGRNLQSGTLTTGWWGVWAALSHVVAVFTNAKGLWRASRLARPIGTPPAAGGRSRPVFARPQPWLVSLGLLAVVGAVIFAVGAPWSSPARPLPRTGTTEVIRVSLPWDVGSCVDGVGAFVTVHCSAPHAGQIVSRQHSVDSCPSGSDSTVAYGGAMLCIDQDL